MCALSSLGCYHKYSYLKSYWPRPYEVITTALLVRILLEPYQYKPIKDGQIRLIRIAKGTGGEIIQCSLTPHVLEPSLEFSALSYVWGDALKRETLLCDGHYLGITSSLHSALWELRESQNGEEISIWADAICINQDDEAEKTIQVQIMGEIYHAAHPVIAWLGVESGSDGNAVELMWRLSSSLQKLLYKGSLRQYSQTQDFPLAALGLPPEADEAWLSLRALFTKPWFSRVWIIQEYVLPRQVIFLLGKNVIESEALLGVAWQADHFSVLQTILATESPESPFEEYSVNSAKLFDLRLRLIQGHEQRLVDLLDLAEDYRSTDPRDRIFALTSLCCDFGKSIINYQRSLTDILIDVAVLSLTACGTFNTVPMIDLLSYVEINPNDQSLPSWVPDWTKQRTRYPLKHVYSIESKLDVGVHDISVDDEFVLTLNGKLFDEVREVVDSSKVLAPMNSTRKDLFNVSHAIVAWNEECYDLTKSIGMYSTGKLIFDAFWRTLIFNVDVDFAPATPRYGQMYRTWLSLFDSLPRLRTRNSLLQKNTVYNSVAFILSTMILIPTMKAARTVKRYDILLTIYGTACLGTYMILNRAIQKLRHALLGPILDEVDASAAVQEARPFNMVFQTLSPGRDFCVTRGGLIGWVPQGIRAGDLLCVFQGCRLPFALRATGRGYHVYGDAYIHGMMDGQPWLMTSNTLEKIRLF